MGAARGLIWAGVVLLLVGAAGYGGGFLYGLRFAYRPEDEPPWLGPLFPASIGVAVLGLLLLAVGLFGRRRRDRG
jgi:hypothetical protein